MACCCCVATCICWGCACIACGCCYSDKCMTTKKRDLSWGHFKHCNVKRNETLLFIIWLTNLLFISSQKNKQSRWSLPVEIDETVEGNIEFVLVVPSLRVASYPEGIILKFETLGKYFSSYRSSNWKITLIIHKSHNTGTSVLLCNVQYCTCLLFGFNSSRGTISIRKSNISYFVMAMAMSFLWKKIRKVLTKVINVVCCVGRVEIQIKIWKRSVYCQYG